jgi:hypothetical protein
LVATSGIATYASGQAISNQGNITALLSASGTATSLIASSGIATYASGQAITNESDIVAVSGIAAYASGHTLQGVTNNGASTTNAITITNNNITASSGLFDSLDMTPLGNGQQPAYQEGVVFYDSENHTLTLYNDEADIALQIGQEQYVRVRNNTATTIENGTAVLINGVHGNAAPTISGAIATSEATSQVIGLATHSIEPNSFGYVTTYGVVRDVDTSAFSAGDELYLSATQIGSGVNTSPVIPNFKVTLGHVITSSPSNGSILVQIGNAKLGGGDVKSEAPLNVSGVPFITSVSDTTAGGSLTDPLFIFDSGNRQLQLGSGLQLLDGAPSNTSNVLYNEGGSLKFNGSSIGGGDVTTSQLNYVSGIAVYASGQSQSLNTVSGVATSLLAVSGTATSLISTSGIAAYASGQAIANESDIVATSGISAYASGLAVTNEGRVNYASGQAIENESDLVAVSGIANYASGQVNVTTDGTAEASKALVLDSAKSFTGVKNGRFSEFDSFVYSTGVSVGNSGVLIARNTPGVTTDTLYNIGGTLYFNGSQLASAGGASAEAQYASGQAIENESDIVALLTASGTATSLVNTSGVATYASGQAISNQGNITALLSASGTATSLIASSGIATYASGQAIANEGDLVAVSGIAAYASGVSLTVKEADNNPNVANVRTIVVSNGTLTDNGGGQVTLTTGGGGGGDVTTTQLNYVSGIAVYASGQSQSLNTVSGVATSLLAVSGTATSLVASSGIATYASGQAIANESDILATSGIANYASGQAISNQGNITALLSASGTATFQALLPLWSPLRA